MMSDILATCGAAGYVLAISSTLSLLAAATSFVLGAFDAPAICRAAKVARIVAWSSVMASVAFGVAALWLTGARYGDAIAQLEAGNQLDVHAFSSGFMGSSYVAGAGLFLPFLVAFVAAGSVLGSALRQAGAGRCFLLGLGTVLAALFSTLPIVLTGSRAMSAVLHAPSASPPEREAVFRSALEIIRRAAAAPWAERLPSAAVFSCIGALLALFAARRSWIVGPASLAFSAAWLVVGLVAFGVQRWG